MNCNMPGLPVHHQFPELAAALIIIFLVRSFNLSPFLPFFEHCLHAFHILVTVLDTGDQKKKKNQFSYGLCPHEDSPVNFKNPNRNKVQEV